MGSEFCHFICYGHRKLIARQSLHVCGDVLVLSCSYVEKS